MEPARPYELAPPRVFGHRAYDFEPRFGAVGGPLPEAGVLVADGLRVVGPHGWPVTPAGELVLEMTAYSALQPDRLGARPFPVGAVQRIEGTLLSLCSDWADTNYAHFMLDAMARLHLVERSSVSIDDVDHIVVAPWPDADGWLRELGLPLDKIVRAEPGVDLVADTVIVTSYPRASRVCPPWVAEFLRHRLGVAAREPRSGVPIFAARRGATRLLSNAAEIEAVAADAGCDVVVPGVFNNPREQFASADLVIGPHGAGLTNLVFTQPGTRVLVLYPSDETTPFYYTLSCAAGLEFACLVGESEGDRPLDAWGPSTFDFSIDPAEFSAALEELLHQ